MLRQISTIDPTQHRRRKVSWVATRLNYHRDRLMTQHAATLPSTHRYLAHRAGTPPSRTSASTSSPSPIHHIQPFANSQHLPHPARRQFALPIVEPNVNPSSTKTGRRFTPLPRTRLAASLRFIGRYAALREIALPSSVMCCITVA